MPKTQETQRARWAEQKRRQRARRRSESEEDQEGSGVQFNPFA